MKINGIQLTSAQTALVVIGALMIFCCGGPVMLMFVSELGQQAGILPTRAPRPTQDISISAIKTEAVQTALAALPQPTKTPKPSRTPRATIAAPTDAATETPVMVIAVPTDAQPDPASSLGTVGEQRAQSGIALTVVEVYETDTISEYINPDPGNIYLVIDVLVENISRSDETPYNPLYFSVKDADGFEYSITLLAPGTPLKSGTLAQGDKARGTLAFEIKSTATDFVLTYEPLVILGGYEPIRIFLGH